MRDTSIDRDFGSENPGNTLEAKRQAAVQYIQDALDELHDIIPPAAYKQPGDISQAVLAASYHTSKDNAIPIMQDIVAKAPDKWAMVYVRSQNGKEAPVLRRITTL
jgi:hypothetical protein